MKYIEKKLTFSYSYKLYVWEMGSLAFPRSPFSYIFVGKIEGTEVSAIN